MTESLLRKIKLLVSNARLNAYTKIKTSNQKDALINYLWNMGLSESLYPLLSLIEVSLRNRLYSVISSAQRNESWLLSPINLLHPQELKMLDDLKRRVQRRDDTNHLISELSFGFWTNLFDKRYEQRLCPELLKQTFPALPRKIRTRAFVSKRFNKIRQLRNRIFHYQRIFHWKDLKIHHQYLLEAVKWLEPECSRQGL